MPWSYEGKWIAIRWLVRVRLRYDESPKRVGEIVRDVSFAMSPTGEPVRPIRGPGSDDDADEDE